MTPEHYFNKIEFFYFLILKGEGLDFNLKPISKQNSENSVFGEFSKVGETTWSLIGVIPNFYPTFNKKINVVKNVDTSAPQLCSVQINKINKLIIFIGISGTSIYVHIEFFQLKDKSHNTAKLTAKRIGYNQRG